MQLPSFFYVPHDKNVKIRRFKAQNGLLWKFAAFWLLLAVSLEINWLV